MDKYKGTVKGINTLQGILSVPVVPSRNYQKKWSFLIKRNKSSDQMRATMPCSGLR